MENHHVNICRIYRDRFSILTLVICVVSLHTFYFHKEEREEEGREGDFLFLASIQSHASGCRFLTSGTALTRMSPAVTQSV